VLTMLEAFLEGINDRIERLLSETFEAGVRHANGDGPAFEAWLKEKLKRDR
jgi:hypothetical protein